MKKSMILCMLSAMLVFTPIASNVKAYDRDITIPTEKAAINDGKIKSKIEVQKDTCLVNPWLYIDIKLEATKSKQSKYNYAELALKRAFGFFEDSKLSLKEGDFYIILNSGYVIDKNNYKDKKVTEVAMKEILNKDYYRGDTLFKLAFLYHDNAVERTTVWNLIDTIDLPAGSSHTVTKHYTSGVNTTEEFNMGQALGIKLIGEAEASSGFNFKFATAKILAKLHGEVNKTVSNSFKNSEEVKSSFESDTKISYVASDKDKLILRYQLIDNYKVDGKTFKNATYKLEELMNQGGVNIVKIEPSSGEKGIDVPTDQIFDVSITK